MRSPIFLSTLATLGLLLGGCVRETPSPTPTANDQHDDHGHDHDHGHGHGHDHGSEAPETFAAAVEELAEMRDAIKTALASNDLKAADGPVHALGHLLGSLGTLAEKAELSDEQQGAVKAAQETLFTSFAAIDETIHGKESGKSWEDVGGDIDTAITSLQELAQPSEPEGTNE